MRLPAIEELMNSLEGDEKTGAQIVLNALEEPVRQIAYNAGVEGSVIVNKIKDSEVGVGYNALTGEYVDMLKVGIVDPTKVTRSAIQNASSIASMILTTESVVADKPDPAWLTLLQLLLWAQAAECININIITNRGF